MRAVSLDQLGLSLGDRIEVGQGKSSPNGLSDTTTNWQPMQPTEGMQLLQVKWQVQPDEGDPIERVSTDCCSCCGRCCLLLHSVHSPAALRSMPALL